MKKMPSTIRSVQIEQLDWQRDSECQWYDPALFDAFSRASKKAWHRVFRAAQICDRCSVRTECMEFGMDEQMTGVWGGFYMVEGQVTMPRAEDLETEDEAAA